METKGASAEGASAGTGASAAGVSSGAGAASAGGASAGTGAAGASAGALHPPIENLANGDWKIYVKDLDGTFKPMIIDQSKIFSLSKKGFPRIKVSKLVEILLDSEFQDLYFYFVHCRRTKDSGTLSNFKLPDNPSKKRGFSQAFSNETGHEVAIETGHEVANETVEEVPFLLIQSHGTSTETSLESVLAKLDLEKVLDKILFRAKLGQLCRQHGPRGRDYVYREIIPIYLAGKLDKPYMTDDILELKDMQIVVSTYNPEVLRPEFALGTQTLSGGSIRKTIKKRRRKRTRKHKTKTRSRTRNRKR